MSLTTTALVKAPVALFAVFARMAGFEQFSEISPVAAFAVAFLVSVAVLPFVRRFAIHQGLLDQPDELRRRHAQPIPRLGGVGVFAGVLAVCFAGALFDDLGSVELLSPFVLSVFAGATILFVTGLVDDVRGVSPLIKLVAQSIAASIVYWAGFHIDTLMIVPGHVMTLGWIAFPVTVLWIVGISNALNLVDGADGLAGGVAAIALVAIAISASIIGDPMVVWISLALLGSTIGFLRFNFPPARIFLGDSGSLVIGFLLSILTVKSSTRSDGAIYALSPIFALAYPLLDTGISMMRRFLRGEPLSRADGRHIHHQLITLGLGPRQSILLVYLLSATAALVGLSAIYAPPAFTIGITGEAGVLLLLMFVYGLRWLQYHEFLEASASLTSAVRKGRTIIRDRIRARDVVSLIQAAEHLDDIVELLSTCAPKFRFVHMELQGRSGTQGFAEPLEVQTYTAPTWKLEFPVSSINPTVMYPISLSIWCKTEGKSTSGAERVARIIAPAVCDWLAARERQEPIEAILKLRFPGVHTPPHGAKVVTGDFSLRELQETRQ